MSAPTCWLPVDDSEEPPASLGAPRPSEVGRPKLGRPRRIRITTTVEPAKLALLREHARRVKKSIGQLADEHVSERFEAPANLREE
jgi:hypothetical protein